MSAPNNRVIRRRYADYVSGLNHRNDIGVEVVMTQPPNPPDNVNVRLLTLMEQTGCDIVQCNGQRKTGPPKNWNGPIPGPGCEVFIGKIPRDMYEDELYPLLLGCGTLYELRLMMDFSGTNRGFGFAQFATPEDARRAVQVLDGFEVRPGKFMGVMKSLDNRRLFVGGLPKDRSKEEIKVELSKIVEGIVEVILYSSVVDKTKSRGFAFVEFESHRVAAIARRKMIPGGIALWNHDLAVDWAEPEPEVSDEIMSKVKVLYMRNLMLSTTEQTIRSIIEKKANIPKQAIEKVKKLKDFAFLHFSDRRFAEQALHLLDKLVIEGSEVAVFWSKPPRNRIYGRQIRSSTESDQSLGLPEINNNTLSPSLDLSCCLTTPPPRVNTLYPGYWQMLTSMCQLLGEPEIVIYTVPGTKERGNPLYFGKIMIPGAPEVITGKCCDTVIGARESAAIETLIHYFAASNSNLLLTPPPTLTNQMPVMFPYPYVCPTEKTHDNVYFTPPFL